MKIKLLTIWVFDCNFGNIWTTFPIRNWQKRIKLANITINWKIIFYTYTLFHFSSANDEKRTKLSLRFSPRIHMIGVLCAANTLPFSEKCRAAWNFDPSFFTSPGMLFFPLFAFPLNAQFVAFRVGCIGPWAPRREVLLSLKFHSFVAQVPRVLTFADDVSSKGILGPKTAGTSRITNSGFFRFGLSWERESFFYCAVWRE